MKKLIVLFFVLTGLKSLAQEKIEPRDKFSVEGIVRNQLTVSIADLGAYKTYNTDSVVITNHLLQKKHTIINLQGVLLKDILDKAEIVAESPKVLSEFYIVCIASDGYKVVFSWNEVFNTKTGESVYILTGHDGKAAAVTNDRITLVSSNDKATGRRYVKGLQRIIVERVK
jgi:hypothetical protein